MGPGAVLGPGCSIASKAVVEASVLWEDVRVGEGATAGDGDSEQHSQGGDEPVNHGCRPGAESGANRGANIALTGAE